MGKSKAVARMLMILALLLTASLVLNGGVYAAGAAAAGKECRESGFKTLAMDKGIFSSITQKAKNAFKSTADGRIQVGEEVTETYETAHPYTGTGMVWEHTFQSPKASYIRIHFSKFDLAAGDYVEISSPDGKYKYRYEGKGKVVRGGQAVLSEFWASHIPGDTAVVRLIVNSGNGYGFVIDKWAHGYESGTISNNLDIESGIGVEAICSADNKEWAACYQGTTMYQKAQAVARLLIGGSSACTGWLLGSEGHLMTNHHCINTQADADNTEYEFMAEGATCTTSCTGWFSCPGVVEASSGTLVKADYNNDYALVLLPTNLISKYGYLQFRNAVPSASERIYIPQHPGGKGKQLAVNDDMSGGYCQVNSTSTASCYGSTSNIGYYCDTEGGSSGSPVLAYGDNLVVGLHHCGGCLNGAVQIPSIITNLGTALPANAIGGSACTQISRTVTSPAITTVAPGEILGPFYMTETNNCSTDVQFNVQWYVTRPDGVTVKFDQRSATIAAGYTGTHALSISIPSTSETGNFIWGEIATDTNGNQIDNDSFGFTVQ